jgi:large subunit ribosomal protein L24
MRGQFKGKIGNVEEVQIKNQRIAVEGVTYTKKDGKKMPYLLHPSKVMILELNLDDRKRKASIDRASKVKSAPKAEVKKAEVKIEAKPKSKEIKK